MAQRPIFYFNKQTKKVVQEECEFQWHPGFSIAQKQRSINSLHQAFQTKHGKAKRILEISTKSTIPLGIQLSAFNLKVSIDNTQIYLENLFQGGKIFEAGGPYMDLYSGSPKEAKRDERLKESGELVRFQIKGNKFPLEPKTYFYDYLYCRALAEQPELQKRLLNWDAFSDIEFNPKKSINCQAHAAAFAQGLIINEAFEVFVEHPTVAQYSELFFDSVQNKLFS